MAAAILLAAGAAIAVVLVVTAEEPGTGAAGGVLAWDEPPLAFTPERLPDDRVAYGTVRNASLERLRASTSDFEVRDASGDQLVASVQFLGSFAHGLYGAFQRPDPLPPEELTRLGFEVDLETGQTAPLTVSYRLRPGTELPATLYYRGAPALELPVSSGSGG